MVFIIILSLLFIFTSGNVFGTNIVNNDCVTVNVASVESDLSSYWINNGGYNNIFSENQIKQSLINLKAYCCEKGFVDNNNCKKESFPSYYPESYFWFDHLIDISYRRLDGEDLYGLSENEYDAKTIEWRKFMVDVVERDIDGNYASTLENKYKNIRYGDTTYVLRNISWNKKLYDTRKLDQDLRVINSEYILANLSQRYLSQCYINVLYYIMKTLNTNYITHSFIQRQYNKCLDIAKVRIQQEYTYTKVVVSNKANKLLENSINVYLGSYFVQNRLSALDSTIFHLSDLFYTVVKSIQEGTNQCS